MQKRNIVLRGERVALADICEEDQPYFQSWLAESEELRRLIDDPHAPTMEDQMKWFTRSKQPDRKLFSLLALPQMQLIGNGGLVNLDRGTGTAQFRITIGNMDYIGKGYGKESTVLILRHGFGALGLGKISLRVLSGNTRALGLYEKVGFERRGEEDGKIVMEISREQFTS